MASSGDAGGGSPLNRANSGDAGDGSPLKNANSGDAGDGSPSKIAKTYPHRLETMQCLMFIRGELPQIVYRQFISLMLEIGRERNMLIEKCPEMVPKILDGHPRVIEAFQHFIQGRNPLQFNQIQHTLAVKFLKKVKECPDISTDDHDALLKTLVDFNNKTLAREYALQKAREFLRNSPQLLQEFEAYTTGGRRDPLPKEQSCISSNTSRVGNTALGFTPDTNNRLDDIQVKATNDRKDVPQLKCTLDQNHDGSKHSLRHKQTKKIRARIINRREGNHKAHHKETRLNPCCSGVPREKTNYPQKWISVTATIALLATALYQRIA
ncbi:hypothetical protein GUJ93_ZPchr0010g10300 [Zizania palustris]|uniref:Uncharacterized protein n=1 Tax=Zizania palustris TaxID=103762 RepID=A0A8J5WBG6_ZIZPA|nr:hypothetical protein GUJ93_ZPchr0010g10300 [Zizania palustris]